ncbi:MAG: sigma-70 family RNA polymerase sigma factor, partial [Clostridia bacterium]|nr:sigma-70 family RNA polymerase sigma factor [Clostridia bacterium]
EAKSYLRNLSKQATQEVCFSDMNESDFNKLCTEDTYDFEYYIYHVSGFDITVKDMLLAEALEYLSEQKRDIILLSYYLDMSDAEIGELLNVVRSTVFRNRKAALDKIKEYMEGKAFEKIY